LARAVVVPPDGRPSPQRVTVPGCRGLSEARRTPNISRLGARHRVPAPSRRSSRYGGHGLDGGWHRVSMAVGAVNRIGLGRVRPGSTRAGHHDHGRRPQAQASVRADRGPQPLAARSGFRGPRPNWQRGNIPTVRYSSHVGRVRGDGCAGPLQTVDDDPPPGRHGGDG
jgi:hypothetical protein